MKTRVAIIGVVCSFLLLLTFGWIHSHEVWIEDISDKAGGVKRRIVKDDDALVLGEDDQESVVVTPEDSNSSESENSDMMADTTILDGSESMNNSTDQRDPSSDDIVDAGADEGSDAVPPAVLPEEDDPVDENITDLEGTEEQLSYISVHQMDEAQHAEEEFDFEPIAELKDGDTTKDLSVYLDYVAPSNPYVNKTVMGFAPYWVLDDYYQHYQMEDMSVIAYFAVACFPDGSLVTACVNGSCGDKNGWDGWNSAALADMVSKAHKAGVKVVLTIKNFDRASIETIVGSSSARAALVSNILVQINAKNADGVAIDFEHIPVSTPVSSSLRSKFASFVDQVADAVHTARPGSHVSVDIMGSSGMSSLIYDVAALGNTSVDSIMVMTYDFHTTSYYSGKKAGPESPLYGDQYWYTVSEAMEDIAAKAPSQKILMGVPYYGLEFPVSGSTWLTKNATVISSGAIATYANVMDPVFDDWHNSSTIQWDAAEKMTWYRYRWPSATSGPEYWQGYYDDSESLGAKYDYVISNGLGGIGIWALGYDDGRIELWNTLRNKFSKEPIVVLFKNGVSEAQQAAVHTAVGGTVVMQLVAENTVIVRPISKLSVTLIADYRKKSEVKSADFIRSRSLIDMGL